MKTSEDDQQATNEIKQPQNVIKLLDDKYKWLASEDTRSTNRKDSENQHDMEFRMQHQKYIEKKLKRKAQELALKKKRFGDSSSDSDQDMNLVIVPQKMQEKEEKSEKSVHSERKSSKNTPQKIHQKRSKSPVKLVNSSIKSFNQNQKFEYVDVMLLSKKGNGIWMNETAIFEQKVIALPGIQYSYYDINKVKLIFQNIGQNCCKVKVSYKNTEFFMAASPFTEFKNKCSPHYFILAKFINEKLLMMGKKLYPQQSINLKGVPELILKNSDYCGRLLKKSQFLGKWNERFVVINKDGLYYYKKLKDEGIFLIPRVSLSEIWTRFQVDNNFIAIKLMHNGSKVQFGIPICDFANSNNWLYHLYGLAFKIQQK